MAWSGLGFRRALELIADRRSKRDPGYLKGGCLMYALAAVMLVFMAFWVYDLIFLR